MSKKQKKWLWRILAGCLLLGIAVVIEHFPKIDIITGKWIILIYLPAYFVSGGDVLKKAVGNILRGQVFDENFLMSLATIGAFGVGEYHEAVVVMIFYQVGELFQNYAVMKSRDSIKSLMELAPEYANLVKGEDIEEVFVEDVEVGSLILVKPGERIPIDGIVKKGDSSVDTSPITGESYPRDVAEGENVFSGCINLTGTIYVKTTKLSEESTSAKILEMVENAAEKKAKKESFITRFAKYYTPAVVVAAAILAFIPPLITKDPMSVWISRALIFLVISCPCALVISIPMGFFAGIGRASSYGILVKGGNALESLSEIDIVAFDKTGTITVGEFKVADIVSQEISKEELLEKAALAEKWSNHPISKSIVKEYKGNLKNDRPDELKELSGRGIYTKFGDEEILVGSKKLLKEYGIEVPDMSFETGVYVGINGKFAGYIALEDMLKANAKSAISQLHRKGIKNTVMLTGDNEGAAKKACENSGIDEFHSNLMPEEKLVNVENLMKSGKVAFIGDGINDTPVLAGADLGIAMGAMGADAAIEIADVVIMDDNIENIPRAIEIGKKTLRIVNQNIVFALGCKGLIMVLGAVGIANIWAAVFADVGVAVIAILNSMRALKK